MTGAVARAVKASQGSGTKVACLCGAAFSNPDKKKGHLDTYLAWREAECSYAHYFPGTTTNRYGSIGEAASELLAHLDAYIGFLDRLDHLKGGLNHLEANIRTGLKDLPILAELVCHSLFHETVFYPFILEIRRGGISAQSGLEMAQFLEHVSQHIQFLRENPALVLTSSADPSSCTLSGFSTWKRADAVQKIHDEFIPKMPYIEKLWLAYLAGAAEKAVKFSAEFARDGLIARMGVELQEACWVPRTNDPNEGLLGSFRQHALTNPNTHTHTFASILSFVRNETEDFARKVMANDDVFLWVIREARRLDAQGVERNRKKELNRLLNERAEEERKKREERAEKARAKREELDNIPLELEFEALKNLPVVRLRKQLEKHKLLDPENIKSISGNKQQLLDKLRAALERYHTNLSVVGPSAQETVTTPPQ